MQNIIEGLARAGEECVVITSRFDKKDPALEQKHNLKIIRILCPVFMFRFCFTVLAVFKVISLARDCDLIHGASYGGAVPSFIAAKILRKKCVFMVYEFMGGLWKNMESNWFASQFYQVSERIISHLPFHKFIAISRYTRNCLRLFGIPDPKLEIVYGGENKEILQPSKSSSTIRKELGFNPQDFIYLAYGRAGITKGFEFLVEAIPLILKKIPTAKFAFILTKSGHKTWDNIQCKLERLPRNIYQFIPGMLREELSSYLAIADCIVIPSLSEGFGLAALEACSLKKRVVATDVGSLPEVVFGEHVLVKPGSPEALAEGCFRAFGGVMDYAQPKDFNWGKTVSQCLRIYRELLGP